MAVLGILTIIAIIAVPAINSIMSNAERDSDTASIKLIERAAETARVAGLDPDLENGYSVKYLVQNGYVQEKDGSKAINPSARVERIGVKNMYFSEHGIGGRNILQDSNNFLNFTPYRSAGLQTTRQVINDRNLAVPEWGATDATRLRFTSKNGTLVTTPQIASKESANVAYSYWIKNMGNEGFTVRYNGYNGVYSGQRLEPGEAAYMSVSGTMRNNYTWFQHQLLSDTPNGSVVDVALWRAQLEYVSEPGGPGSDWRPSPEDILSRQ